MQALNDFRKLTGWAQLAILAVGIFGAAVIVNSLFQLQDVRPELFLILFFLGIVTARSKVVLLGSSTISLLTSVVLMALIMMGTSPAVLVGVCGVVVQVASRSRRFVLHQAVFNVGMIAVTVHASGLAYRLLEDPMTGSETLDLLIPILAASIIYYLGNSVFVSVIVALSTQKSMFRMWHDNFLYTAPSFLISGLVALGASHLLLATSLGAVLFVLPTLYLCFYAVRVYMDSLDTQRKHAAEMSALFKSTLSTLSMAIDAKDPDTHGHIVRVDRYARVLSMSMGLTAEETDAIGTAALLHDIGNLAVPEYILRKREPLTKEEEKSLRQHPSLGAQMISDIKFPYPVASAVRSHHERFDGSGYPDGLTGSNIPLAARILAVVDVFDACTTDPRDGRVKSAKEAIEELRTGCGTEFDPAVVETWAQVYTKAFLDTEGANVTSEKLAGVYRDIHRATREVEHVRAITSSITNATTLKEIAIRVCQLLEKTMPSSVATFWTRVDGNEFIAMIRDGSALKRTLVSGPAATAVFDKRPVVNVSADLDGFPDCVALAVPVGFEDDVLAVIAVYRQGLFTDAEACIVNASVEQLRSAVRTALLVEKRRQDALDDRLTGLGNRRAFEEACEGVSGQDLALVIMDLNSLKALNDKFGHQVGDLALIRVASLIRQSFPDTKLNCRLGGDEFAVLSEAPLDAVYGQLQALETAVAQDEELAHYSTLGFGVSWGLANSPQDGLHIEELINKADRRMYLAKARAKERLRYEKSLTPEGNIIILDKL